MLKEYRDPSRILKVTIEEETLIEVISFAEFEASWDVH